MRTFRSMLPIFLAVVQFAFGAGLPLVQCEGSDGHVRVEVAHQTCSDLVSGESKAIAPGTVVAESPSCSDTPIRSAEWVKDKTADDREAVQPTIDLAAAFPLYVVADYYASSCFRPSVAIAIPDATLRALRTVVLTV
jgi:hypothetical protein